ncbi:8186_t:CDS:10, partial [Paraglomus occultum]
EVTLAPDGFTRQLTTVNGQYPGPAMEVNKGDRILMKIKNKLGNPTAMHAHGMHQRGTPWYDGAPWITQCVIPDDYEFTYNFTVPDEVGTFWYHAHERMQYVDGVFGPLIIHDPDDPYKAEYDEEIIVMLNDYHHTKAKVLLKHFFTPQSQGNEAPPGSKCVDNAGLAKFKFVQNKKYRLRIINASAFSAFFFSIDKHEMEIIEADGAYTKRKKIHHLPINVAQRYSVIVTANQPVDNYIMRAKFQKTCMPAAAANLPIVKAIVHYEGAPDDSKPKDSPWPNSLTECIDLHHKTLQPLKEEEIPESTKKLKLVIAFHNDTKGVVKAFLNESSYVPDITIPSLEKIFKGKSIKKPRLNAYAFDKDGEAIDIYFINTDTGDHPFHMHGNHFWLLGTGDGNKVDEKKLNTRNPLKRDTATIPALGWMVIRFVSDNPGWHLESGLLMQSIVLPDKIRKMQPPKEWTKLCELGGHYSTP